MPLPLVHVLTQLSLGQMHSDSAQMSKNFTSQQISQRTYNDSKVLTELFVRTYHTQGLIRFFLAAVTGCSSIHLTLASLGLTDVEMHVC